MATKIKKISELEQITELSSSSNVVIEENGKAKRIAASNFAVEVPVTSVNGQTGDVVIDIPEVEIPEINYPVTSVNGMTGDVVIEAGSEQVQPDWNQNDPTQPDYVKNRTHWEEGSDTIHQLDEKFIPDTVARKSDVTWWNLPDKPFYGTRTVLVDTTEVDCSTNGAENTLLLEEIIEGQSYLVVWDGIPYSCVAYMLPVVPNVPALGNGAFRSGPGGNNEPFLIFNYDGSTVVFAETENARINTIRIEKDDTHRLDPKFLPVGGVGYTENNRTILVVNGIPEGADSFNLEGGMVWYKISDLTSAEELIGGTINSTNSEPIEITEDMLIPDEGFTYVNFDLPFFIITDLNAANETLGCEVPSVGLYVPIMAPFSLTYGSVVTHKINKAFLPETFARISVAVAEERDETLSEEGCDVYPVTYASHTYDEFIDYYYSCEDAGVVVENYLSKFGIFRIHRGENSTFYFSAISPESGERGVLVIGEDGMFLEIHSCTKATAIADLTAAPTAEDFNNLLAALRSAGYLAT